MKEELLFNQRRLDLFCSYFGVHEKKKSEQENAKHLISCIR